MPGRTSRPLWEPTAPLQLASCRFAGGWHQLMLTLPFPIILLLLFFLPLRIARCAAAAAPRDGGHCRGDPRREGGGRSALPGACEKLIILLYSPGDLRAAKAVQESVPAIPSKSPSPEHHRGRLA